MKEQLDPEEWGESYYFGTYRGHREPEEISPEQARLNLMTERLQTLYDLNSDNPRILHLIERVKATLNLAVEEKIDAEIASKRKEV